MLFHEHIKTEAEREKLNNILMRMSIFVDDCKSQLIGVFEAIQVEQTKDNDGGLAVVLLLTRHVVEMIDGVSILIANGSSINCQLLLRSALDAILQLLYLLEEDGTQRSICYQVNHARKKIAMYRKLDKFHADGIQLRNEIANETSVELFSNVPFDPVAAIAKLEIMLADQPFNEINQHFKAKKPKYWYSAFDGPKSIRDLAKHLKLLRFYETLFRTWSDTVHAGGVIQNARKSGTPGKFRVRLVRHPEGIESNCVLSADFTFMLTKSLLSKYRPDKLTASNCYFETEIKPRRDALANKRLINTDWN